LTWRILRDAGVEANHVADLLECSGLDSESLRRDEPVDALAARGGCKRTRVAVFGKWVSVI